MRHWLFVLAACSRPAPAQHIERPMEHHELGQRGHDNQPMHHRFENADEWAKQFDDPERDTWQMPDKVVAAVKLQPGMTVADVGAGTGYFEARLSRAVGPTGKVLAVDLEPDMVRYMTERAKRENTPNVEARIGKPDDPGLPAVDRILIVDTWHHISDRTSYAKKLVAALKPGGMVVVVDFKLESEKGPPKQHRMTAEQVIAELESAGLRGQFVDVGLPDQYVVSASK